VWLKKVQFYASTFVVKIATFAKPDPVKGKLDENCPMVKQLKTNKK
jgi:hypothetical protein